MNYTDLKALVLDYAHRPDLAAQVEGFIQIAHARIERDLRIQEMVEDAEVPTTTNPFDLPADFLEMKEISRPSTNSTGSVILSSVGRHELARYTGSTGSGPLFYSIIGRRIECQPNGSDRTYRFIYWAKPGALVNGGDTNAVLDRYPNLYLYGALIELYSWIQDTQNQLRTTETYVSEIAAANEAAKVSDAGEALQMDGASSWV